jgi:two-component sensor histidine kinase
MNDLDFNRRPWRIDPLVRLYALILPSVILGLDALGYHAYEFPSQTLAESIYSVARSYIVHWLLVLLPMVLTITTAAVHAPPTGIRRCLILAAAVMLSAAFSAIFVTAYMQGHVPAAADWSDLLQSWQDSMRTGSLLTIAYELHRSGLASAAAFQQEDIARAALDTERDRANLQVLRAQIEPHFLFNTLANLRRLYQVDHRAGARMLENLLRYLEMALPQLRRDESTLAEESRLIAAYLGIHHIRMGQRLRFEIVIPDALCTLSVPTMMLLTLVENAVKHGLDPLSEGGCVRVSAEAIAAGLMLRVTDNGRGIATGIGSGSGTGLANIRARLSAQYGANASLTLGFNQPRGVTATLLLPATPSAAVA